MRVPLLLPAVCAAAALAWFPGTVPAQSEQRIALVIGNAAYAAPAALANPVNDARDMAAALKELGFKVVLAENADHATMRRTIREFEDGMRRAKGVTLFYFAGHGVQLEFVVEDNKMFTMPWSATITYLKRQLTDWEERICAENVQHDYNLNYFSDNAKLPSDETPDF